MAKIEDLINQIGEPRLRTELAAEVKKLKAQKKFGLVFEEHLPETVRLPGFPVRPGELVARKGAPGNDLWLVRSVNGRTAKCVRPDATYTEEQRDYSVKDLVVVKRFGEPIYPVLLLVDRVNRGGPERPWHSLINADNFHALQLLLYCYEGQVDIIYIDPPYNTGARDWKYNNDYVDQSDSWRHSKWLSMMKKRLLLAKRLLKSDGALIVTIDDNEASNLGLLLDSLFKNKERATVIIKYNPSGTTRNGFSRCHEYAYYILNLDQEIEKKPAPSDIRDQNLRRHGNGANRHDSRTMFYPIYVNKESLKIIGAGDVPPDDFHPHAQSYAEDDQYVIWPIDNNNKEKRWYYSRDRVHNRGSEELSCKWVKNRLHVYFHTDNLGEQKYKSVWAGEEYDAGAYGGTLVRNIVGKEFPFPKSLYAVHDCLNAIIRSKPNALVLDFFAGSGTTLHATCLLNAEDKGQRRCIIVTNNEVDEKVAKQLMKSGYFPGDPEFENCGISEAVTWPRCKFVINGKRDDGTDLSGEYLNGREMKEGFNENMEYFKLDFVNPDAVSMGQAFEAILPILWMKAGCLGTRETSRGSKPWFIPKNSPYAVLTKEQQFPAFRKQLKEREDISHVFFVTDSEENFRTMSNALGLKVETFQLYKSYLENFRINTKLPGLL